MLHCVSAIRRVSRLGRMGARIRQADIDRAKKAADKAGLCLKACELRPDGSIRLEFGEPLVDDWRAGSPLYSAAQ